MTDPHADLELIDLEAAAPPASRGRGARADRQDADGARRSRRTRRTLPLLLALALVLAVVGVWSLLAYRQLQDVREDLLDAREQLDQALDAVATGDLARAGELLEASRATFATVPDRVGGLVVAPARLVPGVRRTLDAVADLATGAELVAGSGVEVTDVLRAEGEGLGALTPTEGRIPVETFADLAPVLADAEETLVRAEALVSSVPRTGIDLAVRDARDAFLALMEPATGQITAANRVTGIIPGLFGAQGLRRYMVVASNPTEARGSGGFFGAFTILEADDGQLSFSPVRPTQNLPELPRGTIPWPDPSLEDRYDQYGGTGFIVNLNMTPDFPSAATALERYYAEATGEALDGVIAVDPFAFEALLQIAGPVEVPGYGQVGPEEVVEFVSHDAYSVITDPEERKRLIGLVATAALQGFLDSPDQVSTRDIVGALAEMVDRDSVLMHSVVEEEQRVLQEVGVTGDLGIDGWGDLVAVFLNSGSPSKVDYWLQRTVRYDVTLAPDGAAAGILSTGFTNEAPTSGEPIYMIGDDTDVTDAGDVLSLVSVYCPPGCRFYETPDAGFQDLVTERGVELGHVVTSTWMRLASGRARELVWSYSSPGSWRQQGLDRVYRLTYDHQTMIRPIQLDVHVAIPEGHEATGLPEGADVQDGHVVISTVATTDLTYEITFSPADRAGR